MAGRNIKARGTNAERLKRGTRLGALGGKRTRLEPNTKAPYSQPILEGSGLIEQLRNEMIEAGLKPRELQRDRFKLWMKDEAERDLYFFTRWIIEQNSDRRLLFGKLHREIGLFLTDYQRTRRKLLMCPVGHLKTTFGSHALPLHVLIQQPDTNIYFPGQWGCDQRILLGNESEAKCKENLSVIATHIKENPWIRYLWPEICPSDTKPYRWTDFAIQVPRYRVFAEPSVTAIGAETGFMGRHYSVIVLDDLAGIKAGQSPVVMDRAKRTQAAVRSRLDDPWRSIEIEIGTHQSADDIYSLKQKDTTVEVMRRAIEEGDPPIPIWPEKYPAELVAEMRRTTDPILWALWFMNKPVPSGYTALAWEDVREFRFKTEPGGMEWLVFDEHPAMDRIILARAERRNMNPALRLMTQPPPQQSAMQVMRRQVQLGMSSEQAEHVRLKYRRCGECGIIYENGTVHDCTRGVSDDASRQA